MVKLIATYIADGEGEQEIIETFPDWEGGLTYLDREGLGQISTSTYSLLLEAFD